MDIGSAIFVRSTLHYSGNIFALISNNKLKLLLSLIAEGIPRHGLFVMFTAD